jgi:hypothetical protein
LAPARTGNLTADKQRCRAASTACIAIIYIAACARITWASGLFY